MIRGNEGMQFYFGIIDPENRFCVHQFLFDIEYDRDEETLWVMRGIHRRETMKY